MASFFFFFKHQTLYIQQSSTAISVQHTLFNFVSYKGQGAMEILTPNKILQYYSNIHERKSNGGQLPSRTLNGVTQWGGRIESCQRVRSFRYLFIFAVYKLSPLKKEHFGFVCYLGIFIFYICYLSSRQWAMFTSALSLLKI